MATNTELIQEIAKRVDGQSGAIAQIQQEMGLVRASSEQRRDDLTDEMHQLKSELRVLVERDTARQRELDDRKAQDQKRDAEVIKLREELVASRQENAVLRQQLADHIKHTDLTDTRRWGVIMLVIGTVLSLVNGLVLAFGKK